MLQITISPGEQFDEAHNEFFTPKPQSLQLEHSLVSLSKWESKWCMPFLAKKDITREQTIDYIRCMTITQNVDPDIYNHLSDQNFKEINTYISAPMTATTFAQTEEKRLINREIITSEIVYYWMVSFNIPFECQKWHLNRLLTFINVCNVKNQPKKKISKRELLNRNRALNEMRKQSLNTSG